MTTLSKEDVVQEQIDLWIEAAGFVRSSDDWVCAAKKFAFTRLVTLARADLVAENERLLAANRDCIDHFNAAMEDLTATRTALAVAEADNERLQSRIDENAMPDDYILMADKLAQSQARESMFIKALEGTSMLLKYALQAIGPAGLTIIGESAPAITAEQALAQPLDDSALREMIAGVYEECAERSDSYAYMSANFAALSEEFRALAEKAKGK